MITIEVEVIAPDNQNEEFSGTIEIANKDDASDTCTISVSLATPNSHNLIVQLLQRLIDRFPLLEKIITHFPRVIEILNL